MDKFPFTIRQINPSTHLIRETDKYSEFPHIYAKTVFLTRGSSRPALIVLSDTGCGTNLRPRTNFSTIIRPDPNISRPSQQLPDHDYYNLANFLRATINPNGEIPYLVISTHCHYDHILGLCHLPSTTSGMTTVLSSAHKKSFIVPRSNLAEHSLCDAIGVKTPKYDVGIWAHDLQKVVYVYPNPLSHSNLEIDTGLTILHTPGHTPDSLTWYDRNERYIVVGDSLYERQSPDTKQASEPPMPTIFDIESDLLDWWDSLKKVIGFVRERNEEMEQTSDDRTEEDGGDGEDDWIIVAATDGATGTTRAAITISDIRAIDSTTKGTPEPAGPEQGSKKSRVRLGAAHVTADIDAEDCLVAMQDFMRRILRNEIPSCSLGQERGEETGLWDEALGDGDGNGRFSVKAPLRIMEEGRKAIPKSEIWRAWVG
jgi:glyoxylase-like metal-dependent hydrolase (beta-lactamase superfamily II)